MTGRFSAVRLQSGDMEATFLDAYAGEPIWLSLRPVASGIKAISTPDGWLRVDTDLAAPRVVLSEQSTYTVRVRHFGVRRALVGGLPLALRPSMSGSGSPEGVFTLETGNLVGHSSLRIQWDDGTWSSLPIRIAVRKLTGDADYEWLVDELARSVRALALDYAGATSLPTERTASGRGLYYEDLVFLRSIIRDVERAMERIAERPDRKPLALADEADASQAADLDPARLASMVSSRQALARVSATTHARILRAPIRHLFRQGEALVAPLRVPVLRRTFTFDTFENRFLRFALTAFARRASAIADVASHTGVRSGGIAQEARALLVRCNAMLHHGFFDEVGQLTSLQSTSQVLLREDSYNTVFRAYLEYLRAADIRWDGLRNLQENRDVALLYEMWVFLEVIRSLGRLLPNLPKPGRSAIEPVISLDRAGLVVRLMEGVASRVTYQSPAGWSVAVFNNRTFRPHASTTEMAQSYSVPLRPDISIEVTRGAERRLLLLDAKYRISRYGPDLESTKTDDEPSTDRTTFQRADIYKMHTYRDALTGAFAALAIFPGHGVRERLYPAPHFYAVGGVGAVPLIPGKKCDRSFLDSVLGQLLTPLLDQPAEHKAEIGASAG